MANHVKVRRKALDLTLEEIAKAIGTTKATVMKLERGHMQLTESWLQRLSKPLKCDPTDLIADEWPADVPVIGLIMEKGVLALYRPLPKKGLSEPQQYWQGLEVAERPPEGGYRHVVALKVHGDELEPFLSAGSLVYAADPIEKDFRKYFNQIVVCQLKNGAVYIKKMTGGSSYGRYHLYSLSMPGDVIKDVEMAWCAKVIFFKPS